jgi:hypothetical protein
VANTLRLHSNGAVGFIDCFDLFDVKLKILEWFVIEPESNGIPTPRIAARNLEVFDVERMTSTVCSMVGQNFAAIRRNSTENHANAE